MTEGDAPDAAHDDAPLVVPPGVPLRVLDWLLLPALAVALVIGLPWVVPQQSVKTYLFCAAALVVVACVVQAVYGCRAYLQWYKADILGHRRAQVATVAALAVFAAPFFFGISSAALFALSGSLLAGDPGRGVKRLRSVLSGRGAQLVSVACFLVGAAGLVLHPLASAFGVVTGGLDVFVVAVAALTYGFARRSQQPERDPLGAA